MCFSWTITNWKTIFGIPKWMLGNDPSVANQNKRVPNILPDPSSSWWRDHQTFLQGQSLCRLVRCSKMCWSPRGSLQSKNQNIKIGPSTTLGLKCCLYFNIWYKFCSSYLIFLWLGNVLSGLENNIQDKKCQEKACKVAKCQEHNKALCHAHDWNRHLCY